MSVLARWVVKPRLIGVPGVANVAVWGHREQQLQVQVDPAKLRQNNVTLNQIIATTGNALWVSPLTFLEASTPGTGGFIDTPNQRLGIQHILPIRTPEDLAQVTIEGQETPQAQAGQQAQPGQQAQRRLRLGDVATVVEDHQPLIGDALVESGPGLMLVIEKFPGANTLQVTKDVEAALNSMKPGLTGIEMNTKVYQPAAFIDRAMGSVALVGLIGLLLLAIVLALSFWEWRTALTAFLAVLVSLALAWVVLSFAGYGLNLMLLAGIVLGAVFAVADAVSDVWHHAGRLRERRLSGSELSVGRTILDASLEVRRPMAYATVIALVAAAPVLLLPELTGAFFRPMALGFVATVLASTIVALTFIPAMSLVLLRNAALERRVSPVRRLVQGWYPKTLAPVLRTPAIAYGLAGLVAIGGCLALLQPVAQHVIPALQERSLLVHWDTKPGTSGIEMTRITEKVSKDLQALPGVAAVGAHLGRAITSDQVVNVNSGELWVSIDPKADYGATRDSIAALVRSYPGLDTDVQTYPEERITQLLGGDEDAVVVRVYGQDLDVLRSKAGEVQQMLGGVKGVVDPVADLPLEEPTVRVKVDLAKAQQAGIKPGDVRRAAAAMLSGIQVGNLFEDQKVFEVVVWGAPAVRNSLTSIQDLAVTTPSGQPVRLGDVAEVTVAPSPTVIERDSVFRYVDVTAGIKGRDYRAVVDDIGDRLGGISFPLEHHAELLGSYEHQQENQNRLLLVGLAALIGIFLLMQAAIGSWKLTALLFLALPVAMAGGLVAGLLTGISAISTVAALVAVAALTARFVLQVVGHAQELEQRQAEPFGPDLVTRAAREQAGSILVTTVGAFALLLPLLLLGGRAGMEVLRPIVLVVLGGLAVAALLSLFAVPALYLRFGAGSRRDDLALDAEPRVG